MPIPRTKATIIHVLAITTPDLANALDFAVQICNATIQNKKSMIVTSFGRRLCKGRSGRKKTDAEVTPEKLPHQRWCGKTLEVDEEGVLMGQPMCSEVAGVQRLR
jgi:hypothetical protein